MKTPTTLILTALLLCPLAVAQAPAPDTLVSPTVNADRTVTFRVRARQSRPGNPLWGSGMPVGTQQPMTRDDQRRLEHHRRPARPPRFTCTRSPVDRGYAYPEIPSIRISSCASEPRPAWWRFRVNLRLSWAGAAMCHTAVWI